MTMQVPKQFYRTSILLGDAKVQHLANCHVLVAGVGGVGGYVVESLVRAGVGSITLIDHDVVDITNINRQLIATMTAVGMNKVDLFKERILQINPECNLTIHKEFIDAANLERLIPKDVDYVVDSIDTVESKLALLSYCVTNNIKVVSSQGAGNRYDVTQVKVADISKTNTCALAKLIRLRLRKMGIRNGIKVVYSEENGSMPLVQGQGLRPINGTISYMPAMFGIMLSGLVIKDLIDAQ